MNLTIAHAAMQVAMNPANKSYSKPTYVKKIENMRNGAGSNDQSIISIMKRPSLAMKPVDAATQKIQRPIRAHPGISGMLPQYVIAQREANVMSLKLNIILFFHPD